MHPIRYFIGDPPDKASRHAGRKWVRTPQGYRRQQPPFALSYLSPVQLADGKDTFTPFKALANQAALESDVVRARLTSLHSTKALKASSARLPDRRRTCRVVKVMPRRGRATPPRRVVKVVPGRSLLVPPRLFSWVVPRRVVPVPPRRVVKVPRRSSLVLPLRPRDVRRVGFCRWHHVQL